MPKEIYLVTIEKFTKERIITPEELLKVVQLLIFTKNNGRLTTTSVKVKE